MVPVSIHLLPVDVIGASGNRINSALARVKNIYLCLEQPLGDLLSVVHAGYNNLGNDLGKSILQVASCQGSDVLDIGFS